MEIKIALFYKYVQQGTNNLLVLRSQWYAQYICNTFPDSKQDKESKNSKENIDINILHQMLLYTYRAQWNPPLDINTSHGYSPLSETLFKMFYI